MNIKQKKWVLFLSFPVVLAAAGSSYFSAEPDRLPRFHHTIHLETAALTCVQCHEPEEDGAKMKIPGHGVCQGCHETETPDSCKFCHDARIGRRKPLSHTTRWVVDHGRQVFSEEVKKVCLYCHNGRIQHPCLKCH